ncbi:stage V sporulation protein B [Inconstantimicrobium mannanitabidum]|uniref:Stage V sporulation protein B n=1 Tax=Inconstantimicrobium mannanitabidum TaxID=1604901 RepID=A0ACB5RDN1_9CLOT|nr:stage V sporulation protein B [Clostridium sp. TW13]GKX66871.1 stage V sporulation protein B [Clostridium sp. TW13]
MVEKDSFYKNTFMLTSGNITVGILGFIFSVYLSKVLGSEGMGLYNLVMPVYNLFIGLMTAGIVAAISKISAVYSEKGDYSNLFKSIKTITLFNLFWASVVGIAVFFAAPAIGMIWIKDPRTILAIKVTCPAMIFIALSNILKGYFYGISEIKIPAFIDILEKSMRILVISLLITGFATDTLSSLVCAAYISLAIGELQSLLLLYLYYKYKCKHTVYIKTKTESKFQLTFDILIISLPLCLNAFLNNAFYTFSALIVPRRLLSAGFSYSIALEMIGKYSGMALPVVFFPLVIINSLNTVLIPDLSQTMSKKDYYSANARIKKVLLIVFLIGIGSIVVCNLIPNYLGKILFNKNDLGNYIRAASIAAPIAFTSMTMFGILNGLSKQKIILRNAVLTETLELCCLYVLTGIPSINIYGYAITACIISSLSLLLNLHEVKKTTNFQVSLSNVIIYILVGLFVYFLAKITLPLLSCVHPIITSLTIICIVYGLIGLFAIKYSKTLDIN